MPRRAGREMGWRAQDLRPCSLGHLADGYGVTCLIYMMDDLSQPRTVPDDVIQGAVKLLRLTV